MTTALGPNAVAEAICDRARPALGALVVNMAILGPDLKSTSVAWSIERGSLYQRALAAARKIMPGIDPVGMRVNADLNSFTSHVLLLGQTQVAPFEEAARYAVHPMVTAIASRMLGMRWSVSIPLVVGPRIVGSFSAHFAQRPTDAQRALAATFATEAAAEMDRAGAFR